MAAVRLPHFPVELGNDRPLVLIAGPSVIEPQLDLVSLATEVGAIAARHGMPFVFKASYDKANRTRLEAYRGPGLERGLAALDEVRRRANVPVLTDVHSPAEARAAAAVVDLLQVPAFLCRQTDLLVAAGATGLPVHLKKGPFMAPEDMTWVCSKVRLSGGQPLLGERGTTFGYHDLVVDMRGLATLADLAPVVFDATHAVQKPGAAAGASGGDRRFIAPLARAAAAVGVAALFLEVHPDPARALSDAATALPLAELDPLLSEVLRIDRAAKPR